MSPLTTRHLLMDQKYFWPNWFPYFPKFPSSGKHPITVGSFVFFPTCCAKAHWRTAKLRCAPVVVRAGTASSWRSADVFKGRARTAPRRCWGGSPLKEDRRCLVGWDPRGGVAQTDHLKAPPSSDARWRGALGGWIWSKMWHSNFKTKELKLN